MRIVSYKSPTHAHPRPALENDFNRLDGSSWDEFFLISQLSFAASPEDEVRLLVKKARTGNYSGDLSILEILITHPTEPVVFQAAHWPWSTNVIGERFGRLIRPWMTRSPDCSSISFRF